MVKLNRIYTRTGDDGSTGLGDGGRVSKADIRVDAYGHVDEANAALGVCMVEAGASAARNEPHAAEIQALLGTIINEMFDVGADLCCPLPDAKAGSRLRMTAGQATRLEHEIDHHNARLAPLDSFVLPGGTPLAAALHVARTVVRRAERACVSLSAVQPKETNPEVVRYLNRLSDLLFILCRVANNDGKADVKWVPGASRGSNPPS